MKNLELRMKNLGVRSQETGETGEAGEAGEAGEEKIFTKFPILHSSF